MFMPATLQHAFALAKLREVTVAALQQRSRFGSRSQGLLPTPKSAHTLGDNGGSLMGMSPASDVNNSKQVLGKSNWLPRVTRVKDGDTIAERKAKGLCFWCDDKYTVGHKCTQKKLLMIELDDEEADQEVEMLMSMALQEHEIGDDVQISLFNASRLSDLFFCQGILLNGTVHWLADTPDHELADPDLDHPKIVIAAFDLAEETLQFLPVPEQRLVVRLSSIKFLAYLSSG